jgi:hypothetical protein
MYVHGLYLVHIYPKYYIALLVISSVINTYIHCTHSSILSSRKKYHGKKNESYHKAD